MAGTGPGHDDCSPSYSLTLPVLFEFGAEPDSRGTKPDHDDYVNLSLSREQDGESQVLSARKGFQAMSRFLEQYNGRMVDCGELAALLSDIQLMPDGMPADPAAWQDWLEAVRKVLADSPR